MESQIQKYLAQIKADYSAWQTRGEKDELQKKIAMEMIADFNSKLRVIFGKKYIKIVSNGGAHSFIQAVDDGKFFAGDVLKAASWAAPARNFSRGNILDGTAKPTWTGVV